MEVILYTHPSPRQSAKWIADSTLHSQLSISGRIITCAFEMLLYSKMEHGYIVTPSHYQSPFVYWAMSYDVMLWLIEYHSCIQEEHNRLYHSKFSLYQFDLECRKHLSTLIKIPFTEPNKEWLPYDCVLENSIDSFRKYSMRVIRSKFRRPSRRPYWSNIH